MARDGTVDPDGLALAAIHALYERNLALEAHVQVFETRLAELEELRARLTALERVLEARDAAMTIGARSRP